MMDGTHDLRGRQLNIFRLAGFDASALVHMVFYRVLIFIAPVAAVAIAVSLMYQSQAAVLISRILIAAVWILFTPQLFSAFKAFSLVYSGGGAFGRFSESFERTQNRSRVGNGAYRALPYACTAVWIAAFAAMMFMWFL